MKMFESGIEHTGHDGDRLHQIAGVQFEPFFIQFEPINCCRTVFLKTRTAVKSDADSGAGQVEKDWKDERQSYINHTH